MLLLRRIFRSLIIFAFAAGLSATGRAQDFSQPETEPNPQNALIRKDNDALTSGDLPTALELLTRLNQESPKNAQVLYDLGLTLEAIADQGAAAGTASSPQLTPEAVYRSSIEANSAFAPPRVALGLLLARAGHNTEARSQLADGVAIADIDPSLKARALRALARLDLHSNTSAASSELLEAIRLSPERPEDILLSAQIAEAAADFPGAERAYRRYLALPQASGSAAVDDISATSGLAHALLALHNVAEAEAVLTPALARHPGDPALTAQLAQTYLSSSGLSRARQAIPLLEQLHTAQPKDANLSRLLARAYAQTGDLEKADTLYAALIAAAGASPDPTLLDARAGVLLNLKRPAEAEDLLRPALAHPAAFPSHEALGDAAMHLAFAASQTGHATICLQALAVRATVLPPSPPSLFLEATAYDTLHQSSKAAELYRRFLETADGQYPDEESQVRKRISELAHLK